MKEPLPLFFVVQAPGEKNNELKHLLNSIIKVVPSRKKKVSSLSKI